MKSDKYDKILEKFKKIKENILSNKNNYRSDIKDIIKISAQEYNTHQCYNSRNINMLKSIQNYANHDMFKDIVNTAKYFKEENAKLNNSDSRKYMQAMSRRLDRASITAMKHLESNKETISKKKINNIYNLLEISEEFENEIKKYSSSKLEKSLKIFSFAAIIASLIFNSTQITGNVIYGGNFKTFSVLIASLFFMGLLGVFLTQKK